jgi:type VI secretion system protein ImpH
MSDLISRLCSEAHDFSFFRAVMLLEDYFRQTSGVYNPVDAGRIRFIPDPSTAFPPNDIAGIREHEGTLTFTLSFMGLVGVTSPLPVYFSEYMSTHSEAAGPLYDFLTIFNHRVYSLFFRAWKKYHFLFNFTRDGSDSFTRKVAMLAGLDTGVETRADQERNAKRLRLLAYCGILSSSSRSAAGLRVLLSSYFDGIPVKISEFTSRWAPLRNVKPIGTDTPLGRATILGTTYFDRAGKFRVVVGPLSRTVYEQFLPGTRNIADMKTVVETYLSEPLEYDIEVQLQSIELVPVILGKDETRLGETSSLGRSDEMTDIQSIVIK